MEVLGQIDILRGLLCLSCAAFGFSLGINCSERAGNWALGIGWVLLITVWVIQ